MHDGSIDRDGERVCFRYERRLAHRVERVWAAITVPAEIERWTGTRPELDLRPGGEYVVVHDNGTRVVDHVVRVEPPTRFEHTFWAQLNPSARVTWRLRSDGDDTVLVLRHAMSEDDVRSAAATVALGDHPVTIMSRNAAGWHRLLDRVESYLDDRAVTWTREDQLCLQQHYEHMLVPDDRESE